MARVVGSESIATGDFILISHSIPEGPAFDSLSDWKAKVFEVRALDEEHVYIRVSWLNRSFGAYYSYKMYRNVAAMCHSLH